MCTCWPCRACTQALSTLCWCFFTRYLSINRFLALLRVVCIVASLLLFAVFTGLSASVVRASLMLSFVAAAKFRGQMSNIYNAIAASAFLLLIFRPTDLFSVGFQLSYSAVIGIVFFYPRFNRLFASRYAAADYFSKLFSLSLSAQLTTFLLVIYYFGQISPISLLANLVIIPVVGVLVPAGYLFLVFANVSPLLTSWLAVFLNVLIDVNMVALNAMAGFRFSVVQGLSLCPYQLVALLGALVLAMLFMHDKKIFYVTWALTLLTIMFALNIYYRFDNLA
ncbi:MAG: ComEC/Rec2 family competence protein, partial [Bacteroidales bacterium]|nr:ComEC/Rec2 family competence protein [Bacteroidales bacterium]